MTQESYSTELSNAMIFAGFQSNNAALQSGMALALEKMIRLSLKWEQIFIFGSFADGWGSNLTQLDGTVSADSDLDFTLFLPDYSTAHVSQDSRCSCSRVASDYDDGYISIRHQATSPNMTVEMSEILPALDIIIAMPCCAYPPLADLTNTCISSHVQDSLKFELLQSPKCHAVAASRPNFQGEQVRVSTTLLERIVMHNLSTIQGQLFILIKFLIKSVISDKVKGLKSYIAKTLLFFMLHQTPAGHWKPNNLVNLVRQSLQLLVTKIDSSRGADVCMAHFFLKDAYVYFKTDHAPKEDIIKIINEVIMNIEIYLETFKENLSKRQVNSVDFHIFLPLIGILEILSTDAMENYMPAYNVLEEALPKLYSRIEPDISEDDQFQQLLIKIERMPECGRGSKSLLTALAHIKHSRSQESAGEFVMSGVTSQTESLSVQEATGIVLNRLRESKLLTFELSADGQRVTSFPLMEVMFNGSRAAFRLWNWRLLSRFRLLQSAAVIFVLLARSWIVRRIFRVLTADMRRRFRLGISDTGEKFRSILRRND